MCYFKEYILLTYSKWYDTTFVVFLCTHYIFIYILLYTYLFYFFCVFIDYSFALLYLLLFSVIIQ